MTQFVDHFAATATQYARARPTYPEELFDWLAERSPSRALAWDCGTGSGQAAQALGRRFDLVIASDPSLAQLAQARREPSVHYVAMTAEAVALPSASVDLVTVAQALHWFDRPTFYAEVRRVLVPGGLLAAWRYGLASVDPRIDAIVKHFHGVTVGPYWPAERAIVDAGYQSIEFPEGELPVPPMSMEARWSLDQFAGYLASWSAVARYRASVGADPVPLVATELSAVWGDVGATRIVRWPFEVRVSRKEPGLG